MDGRIITTFEDLHKLRADWERLWTSAMRANVFNSFSYVEAWWRVYGERYRVFTPVVTDGDEVVAILPLILADSSLRFFCFSDADFNDALVKPGGAVAFRPLFATLEDARSQWTSCFLENVPEDSPLLQWLRGTSLVRFSEHVLNVCPTINLRKDREAEFERLLGKKPTTQEEKRLQRFGNLQFRHIEDRAEILNHLPVFFRQHAHRWALEGTRGRFTHETSRDFYKRIVMSLDPSRELRFSVLEAGSIPLAYHLGFEWGGRMLFFKPTFDIDYWDFSPGRVLLRKLLQYARDKNLEEFDFSIGDEDYKHKYANLTRHNYEIRIANTKLTSRVKLGGALAKHRVKSLLKKHMGESAASLRRPRKARNEGEGERAFLLTPSPGPPGAGSELIGAKLSDLAELWLQWPQLFSVTELQQVRALLKSGESFLFLRQDGEICGGWRLPSASAEPATTLRVRSVRASSGAALKRYLFSLKALAAREAIERVSVSPLRRQQTLLAAVLEETQAK